MNLITPDTNVGHNIFEEDDINKLPVIEREKKLVKSLLENDSNTDGSKGIDEQNIKKSLNFVSALVDSILQKFLQKFFPNIIIPSPNISFGKNSIYVHSHEIKINFADVDQNHIDLLVIIAHEYGHSIIYGLFRRGILSKQVEDRFQEQICDFIAGYCLKKYHENFGNYDKGDFEAGRKKMKDFGDKGEEFSISQIKTSGIFGQKLGSYNTHGTGYQRRSRYERGYNSDEYELYTIFQDLINKDPAK